MSANVVVWAFFGIAFLWDWNENTFSSPVATAEFSKFAGMYSVAPSQHHLLGFGIAQLEFYHLHSEFYLVLFGDLDGKEIQKKERIYVCK